MIRVGVLVWSVVGTMLGFSEMAEKIKTKSGTAQGFEIVANREGLVGLAVACLQMAMQPENNEHLLKSGGNHWHFAEWNNNVEPGSDDFIIVYKPDL